ncbi:FAD-dependent oxidoreductase [Candidatus Woesearchaeota archaeon]|nr:FAD-dependent oxidoreductase [Candidatus Woesearchaeota archaeon]
MSKNIIIIGGGFCGAQCAKILDGKLPDNHNLLLFDNKDYFQFTPSIHKLLTKLSYERKIKVPYTDFLKRTRVITEPVSSVTKNSVKAGSKNYPFDYLVICSGAHVKDLHKSKNVFLLKTVNDAKEIHEELKKANHVTIVGGGLTGTEVAGELINKTKKRINLIEKHDRLLSRQNIEASSVAFNYLQKKCVDIFLGQEIIKYAYNYVLTSGREKIPTDLIIWCTGIEPNLSFLGPGLKNKKDSKGLLTTLNLNLQGFKNIFVGGDITNLPEEKCAQNAEYHGQTIAENILRSIKKDKLVAYIPRPRIMVISLGDYHAMLTTPENAWDGVIPAILKKVIEVVTVGKYKHSRLFFKLMLKIEELVKNLKETAKKQHKRILEYEKNLKNGKIDYLSVVKKRKIYKWFTQLLTYEKLRTAFDYWRSKIIRAKLAWIGRSKKPTEPKRNRNISKTNRKK